MGAIAWVRMAKRQPTADVPVLFYDAVREQVHVGDLRKGAAFWSTGADVGWHATPGVEMEPLLREFGGSVMGRMVRVEDVSHWAPLDRPALTEEQRATYATRREAWREATYGPTD